MRQVKEVKSSKRMIDRDKLYKGPVKLLAKSSIGKINIRLEKQKYRYVVRVANQQFYIEVQSLAWLVFQSMVSKAVLSQFRRKI